MVSLVNSDLAQTTPRDLPSENDVLVLMLKEN